MFNRIRDLEQRIERLETYRQAQCDTLKSVAKLNNRSLGLTIEYAVKGDEEGNIGAQKSRVAHGLKAMGMSKLSVAAVLIFIDYMISYEELRSKEENSTG